MSFNESENWSKFQIRITSFSKEDRWLIGYAYQLSKSAHRSQLRANGERYFEHPRAVAIIILDEFKLNDPNLVIGALLHDVGEDSPLFGRTLGCSFSEWTQQANYFLTKTFNPIVADMVLAVTRPFVDGETIKSREQAEEVSLQTLLKSSSQAKIIKMGDRLHNLRTLIDVTDRNRQIRKIDETLNRYFPIFRLAEEEHPDVVRYALAEMTKSINTIMSPES